MFYSQLLLSKKGALGIIWMAAHCHKRLKKDQVQQTDISSSVDKILDDEVPIVTHRILAFLLLGIVRIYSKKVEYLFHDCQEVLNRLRSFKTGKKARRKSIEVPHRNYHSISLPKRFELDTFDLGLDQDVISGKVRSHEQDGRSKDCNRSRSSCKAIVPISEAYSTADTPPRDVLGAHRVDRAIVKSSSRTISLAGVEVLRRALCSLEHCGDPIELDESAEESEIEERNGRPFTDAASPNLRGWTQEEQMDDNPSHKYLRTNYQGMADNRESDFVLGSSSSRVLSLPSLEILRGIGFPLEDRLDPMVLDEAEKEQLYDRPSDKSTSSNCQGSIQDVEFNSVMNRESDFVLGMGSSSSRVLSLPSLEILRGVGFPLEDRLDPMVLDEAEKEQLYDRPSDKSTSSNCQGSIQDVEFNSVMNKSPKGSNPEESVGTLHGGDFSLEHSTSFKLLNGSEKREVREKPSYDEHGAEGEHMDHLSTPLNIEEGENQEFTETVDNVAQLGLKLLEVIAPESVTCQKPDKFHVPVLNPHSKLPDVGISEVTAVQTPGRKERAKILKKRKALPLMDDATVVPNKVLKSWIGEDPTDLRRIKKATPFTLLQVWKARKLCHLPHSFLEPLVPVNSTYLGCRDPQISSAALSVVTHGSREQIPENGSPIAEKSSRQQSLEHAPAVRSPVAEIFPDQIPIAPGTPVAYSSSSRFHEAATVADSDILDPLESLENLDALFQEGNSSNEGDNMEKGNDTYSARTRMSGSYLARKFLDMKNRKEEQVLNLSRLLAGKTKRESSIMFYEILVLKSRDCIDVLQHTAYCDILLHQTPKLTQYFK